MAIGEGIEADAAARAEEVEIANAASGFGVVVGAGVDVSATREAVSGGLRVCGRSRQGAAPTAAGSALSDARMFMSVLFTAAEALNGVG